MRIHQEVLEVTTRASSFCDVTPHLLEALKRSKIQRGLCTAFVQHTSASLLIQENADPAVRRDIVHWLSELAPEDRAWEHEQEGPDDMPSHAKAALTRTSEQIPIQDGRFVLGTWQGVFLLEHRRTGHRRRIFVHIMGE